MKSKGLDMNDVAWEIAHSVDANASPAFAWTYMTNIANWDDPPAEFELDGPFAVGSRGTTRMPGQEPRHWRVCFTSYSAAPFRASPAGNFLRCPRSMRPATRC